MVALSEQLFKRDDGSAQALVKKYAPRCWDELLGQPLVVRRLKSYVARPYACAMLFHGNTGTGKTCAANIVARELIGAYESELEWCGLSDLAGDRTPDDIRTLHHSLWYRPLGSTTGWRVVIINEADRMLASRPNETVWLNMLESLPPKVCVIFTTNDTSRLTNRFRDRCEEYSFQGGDKLKPFAQALAARIWTNEGLAGKPPAMDLLGMGSDGISFRLVVQQVSAAIALAKSK